jgi:hypothetical protein
MANYWDEVLRAVLSSLLTPCAGFLAFVLRLEFALAAIVKVLRGGIGPNAGGAAEDEADPGSDFVAFGVRQGDPDRCRNGHDDVTDAGCVTTWSHTPFTV